MIRLHHNVYIAFLLALTSVLAWVSCAEDHLYPEEKPTPKPDELPAIAFASVTADQESTTRADGPTLGHDFVVYGYKNVGVSQQTVFDGYTVKYRAGSANTSEDNSHGYYYVGVNGQSLKYWDFSATEYNFWGYTGDKNDFDGTVLTIDLEQSVTEPAAYENQLFSVLYHRSPVSTDVVQLQFKRPYAKVRVRFYSNTELTDQVFENIKISDITFGPESPGQIVTSGSLKVTYKKTGEEPETIDTIDPVSGSKLTFEDLRVLTYTQGTASNNAETAVPTGGTEWYYVVPYLYGDPFVLTATIDNEDRTAVVPANFMQWKPNFVYTYIFKVSGGKYMEFYDVQIEPWKYGGSQEVEWKNW